MNALPLRLGAATAILLALAACAPQDTAASSTSSSASSPASAGTPEPSSSGALPPSCAKDKLALTTPGTLTIATDKPAYEPWFSNDDPSNGKGYESAVGYAIADTLGFTKDQVTWTVASFNSVIAPGPKTFDFDLNQVSITPERKSAVDFSSGYYDVTQAVVTDASSPIADATSLADLKSAKLGAQVGTTSYDTITQVIRPTQDPAVFDTNDAAKAALANGQIDGLVVDLPTALYLAAAEIKGGKVVGQIEGSGSATSEQFGAVLDKGSPLTSCVSAAVDVLRANGTLSRLQQQWLTDSAGAPVLK